MPEPTGQRTQIQNQVRATKKANGVGFLFMDEELHIDTGTVDFGPPIPQPQRRRLRTYAFDPMSTRLSGQFLHFDVPFERDLQPGPRGELVHVVDYNPTLKTWYAPVDLDNPSILAQDGLRPDVGDPRTHQQIVYAVSMSVIERVEKFMGRRFRWRTDQVLRLVPHAFEGANAYFDPDKFAVMFGYYRARSENPGQNLPGQMIYTCLSNDIIAHEVAHALVHRVRKRYLEPTNPDVLACHEALADLVALFQHFAHRGFVYGAVKESRGDLRESSALLSIAHEFGNASGRGQALRSAIGTPRTPDDFWRAEGPHERGACFVSAVFDAYLDSYQEAISDLVRIATGGSGIIPEGYLQSDLVGRITDEAVRTADRVLGIVVRSFDYLPVIDVTFGDIVRAIVTADSALFPDDKLNLRGNLVEAFRRRGIVPSGVASLADESLTWQRPVTPLSLEDANGIDLPGLILSATMDLDKDVNPKATAKRRKELNRNLAGSLKYWGKKYAAEIGLQADFDVNLEGIHVAFRQAEDRLAHPEISLQLIQRRRDLEDDTPEERERPVMLAGTTLIAGADGSIKYIISKPLPAVGKKADDGDCTQTLARFPATEGVGIDTVNEYASWGSGHVLRSGGAYTFAALHQEEDVRYGR